MKGFSSLEGGGHNLEPLERRKEIQKDGLEMEGLFDDSPFRDENGNLNKELIDVELYTLSGFVIEELWDDLKSREGTFSKEGDEKIPIDENFWKNFADRYIAIEKPAKEDLIEGARVVFKKPEAEWSTEDKMLIRWLYLNNIKTETLGVPSFGDLITIYARLARVAGERFRQQYGKEPNPEEYRHMVSDKSFNAMMMQMMVNKRQTLLVTFGLLEGDAKAPDTDDTSRKFTTKYFEVSDSETGPIVQPDEEFLTRLRGALMKMIEEQRTAGKKPGQTLRCPVIYTGKFQEMCDWLLNEFEHHYLSQLGSKEV